MKNFVRTYPSLSLCGLNCGLCTMHLGGHCPGCGGGDGNQSCSIARCSVSKGVEFCSLCEEFACAKYDGIDEYDSFISTRNMRSNLERVKRIGLDACKTELEEKLEILHILLERYNDGRHKSPFCTAVNLLDMAELRQVMEACEEEVTATMTIKERAALVTEKINGAAARQGISLKMRRKLYNRPSICHTELVGNREDTLHGKEGSRHH